MASSLLLNDACEFWAEIALVQLLVGAYQGCPARHSDTSIVVDIDTDIKAFGSLLLSRRQLFMQPAVSIFDIAAISGSLA